MREAVIVEALRTPIARGKIGRGDLSGFHAAQLLGRLQKGLVEKAGLEQLFGRHRQLAAPGVAARKERGDAV